MTRQPYTAYLLRISLALAALLLVPALHGQRITNSIVGIVTDPSGAVIPNAEVTAINRLTGVTYQTVRTDKTGYYVVTELPQGEYVLRVVRSGFKTLERGGITLLEINQTARVDLHVEIGAETQTVTVTGREPLVNSESAGESSELDRKSIVELPMSFSSGRNIQDLMLLGAGATSKGGVYGNGNYSVNGSPQDTQVAMVDGATPMGNGGQWYLNRPMPEELQTVKIETAGYSAEYGGMGAINMTTVSGTNKFHGSAYYEFTNGGLTARNYFATSGNVLSLHESGFQLGGPIIKDRTFFSVMFKQFYQKIPEPGLVTVPTAAMGTGDFSAIPTLIYDPMTTCGQYGNPACATDSAGNPIVTRQPFPNNQIPTPRLDPVAQKLLQYWPAPNNTPASALPINNYSNGKSTALYTGVSQPYTSVKIDHNINQSNHLFGRVAWWDSNQYGNASFAGPGGNGFAASNLSDGWVVTLGDTHNFSPTWVNEFRTSYNRSWQKSVGTFGANQDIDGKVGLQNMSPRDFPMISVGGLLPMALGGCCFGLNQSVTENYLFTDNLTHVLGRNIIKVGGGVGWDRDASLSGNAPSGTFDFSGIFSTNLQANNSGVGFADFLLGLSDNTSVSPPGPDFGFRMPRLYVFGQDDIKITPKLVVNLGMRYERFWGPAEGFNKTSNFSPTAINPVTGTPGAVVFAGIDAPARFASPTNSFQPRLGIVYSPNHQLAIRAGMGIYGAQNPESLLQGMTLGFNPIPFTSVTTDQVTPAFILQKGLAAPVPVTLPKLTADIGNGQNVTYIPSVNSPALYSWTLSIQQQLPWNLFVEGAYIGNRGIHLWFPRNIDQVPADLLGVGNAQAHQPYPQFTGVQMNATDGVSRYNSFQLVVTRPFAHGLQIQANYTFSRSLNTSSYDFGGGAAPVQNIYNLRAEYGPSDSNNPQVFNLTALYEIPRWLPGAFGNAVTRGWQLNNVVHAQAGFPINMSTAINQSGALAGSLRPNRTCSGKLGSPTIEEWFDPSCFALPAPFTFGDSGRNVLNGPGFTQWDFSTFKNTYFKTWLNEQTNVQFRAEFFNFLNHPNFNQPNSTIGSGSAGTITGAMAPRAIDFGFRFVF